VHDLDDDERRAAYACDITYGTNNEYGFDYLRDQHEVSLVGLHAEGATRTPLSMQSIRS